MTQVGLREYVAAVGPRYRKASKKEKGQVLDEFCRTTGMHRKSATRLLNGGCKRKRGGGKRGRPVQYGPKVTVALLQVWEVADRMCGRLLVAMMPALLAALERHGELHMTTSVRGALLTMSAATIDRRLRGQRRSFWLRQPYRRSAPTGLKKEIEVRTWGEWKGAAPGSVQADLVLHCGESTEGFYLSTLTAIDVATGWVEMQPVWGTGMNRVGGAVNEVARRMPIALRELHTDNGGEFINRGMYNWCRRHGVRFTRGRAYRKNDQAYVEQRNWQAVRRSVGYQRYKSKAALSALARLYALSRLQLNFFRPVRKIVGKARSGSRVRNLYDDPRTPYQRLIESGVLNGEQRKALEELYHSINPAKLQREIEHALRALWACTMEAERRKVG